MATMYSTTRPLMHECLLWQQSLPMTMLSINDFQSVPAMCKWRLVWEVFVSWFGLCEPNHSQHKTRRAHPDLNQGPADLQSAALTTELCTHVNHFMCSWYVCSISHTSDAPSTCHTQCTIYSSSNKHLCSTIYFQNANGLLRELNPGPLAPEARIMPLDQAANI